MVVGPISFDPDKFGYYQSGSLKTYRKLEAIQSQDRSGFFPEWHFNTQAFDHVDWFTEPDVDLWHLYQERCRQIRQAYDYCVLFYSGGSDSDNMLRAWIDSGCQLDEIATIKIPPNHNRGNFDWAVEIPNVVEPRIEQLRQRSINFRYREIDSIDHTIKFLEHHIENYVFRANHSFSPNNLMKSHLRTSIEDYRQMIDAGLKLCFVWGTEKPQIRYDPDRNQWFFDFYDIIDNCVPLDVQENYHQGWFDELFYWTPDMPLIPVKQAHVLRKWCSVIHDVRYYQKNQTPYGFNRVVGQYLTESAAKKAIYPQWDPTTLVAPKAKFGAVRPGYGRLVFSERDNWFFSSNSDLQSKYESQIGSVMAYLSGHSRFAWQATQVGRTSLWQAHVQSHRFA